MSHHPREPRGAQDFSSPQVRVRGANDFRHYSNQRLRLPNERPPLGPRIRQFLGVVLTLVILGGIGVGVYFGVTVLLDQEDSTPAEVAEPVQTAQPELDEEPTDEAASTTQSEAGGSQAEPAESAAAVDESDDGSAAGTEAQVEQPQAAQDQQQAAQPQPVSISVSSIEPTISDELVTPAQLNGAEIAVERVTAEPIPSGIPRMLADGAAYDPTEPATVFTSRWPVGTTLRLIRLPGATLLTDEEQAEVVGSETLVVVRGSESSNTDLQLSPAAFDRIAYYGTERIIAVSVEVTAPPP
jgi:hypothetical protein